jgi:queuosine precursor transporter
METTDQHPRPHDLARFAETGRSLYPIVVGVFVALLLLSNIGAVKLISFGPIITDGGVFLFPLVYIVGDLLTEVYGFKAARRAIILAFSMSVLAAITFWLIQISPPAADWGNQEAFESVLGVVPRIVIASITAFLVGQLLNAYVLVWIKERTAEKALWLRLLASSAVGQLVDTLIFGFIAFWGIITGTEFVIFVLAGYVYKVAVEVILLPVSYRVIAIVKRREPTYGLVEA